jgi:hypothetical protein
MTTKSFTKIPALLLGASLLSGHFTQVAEAAPRKPNILFMYLAFNAPHDPCQAPKEFVDMYPVDTIAVPQNFMNGVKASPSPATSRRTPPQRRPVEH